MSDSEDINPSVTDSEDIDLQGCMVASIGNGRGEGVVEADADKKNVSLLLWRC